MKVSVYEAKAKLSQMINMALEGEEVIITRNGTETVRLVPVPVPKKKNWIGMWKGQGAVLDSFFDPIDDEEIKYLTGEMESKFPDENTD